MCWTNPIIWPVACGMYCFNIWWVLHLDLVEWKSQTIFLSWLLSWNAPRFEKNFHQLHRTLESKANPFGSENNSENSPNGLSVKIKMGYQNKGNWHKCMFLEVLKRIINLPVTHLADLCHHVFQVSLQLWLQRGDKRIGELWLQPWFWRYCLLKKRQLFNKNKIKQSKNTHRFVICRVCMSS